MTREKRRRSSSEDGNHVRSRANTNEASASKESMIYIIKSKDRVDIKRKNKKINSQSPSILRERIHKKKKQRVFLFFSREKMLDLSSARCFFFLHLRRKGKGSSPTFVPSTIRRISRRPTSRTRRSGLAVREIDGRVRC